MGAIIMNNSSFKYYMLSAISTFFLFMFAPIAAAFINIGEIDDVTDIGNVIHIKLMLDENGNPQLIFENAQLGALIGDPNVPDDQFVAFERPKQKKLSCVIDSGIDHIPIGAFRNAGSPSVQGRVIGPVLVFDEAKRGGKLLSVRYINNVGAFLGASGDAMIPLPGANHEVKGVVLSYLQHGVAFNPAPQIVVDTLVVDPAERIGVCPGGITQQELGL